MNVSNPILIRYKKKKTGLEGLIVDAACQEVVTERTPEQRWRQKQREERIKKILGPQANGTEIQGVIRRENQHILDTKAIARMIGISRYSETLTDEDANRLLSVKEVAYVLNVPEGTLKRWTDNNLIGCLYLPGGVKRFRIFDLQRFLQGEEPAPSPAPRPVYGAIKAAKEAEAATRPKRGAGRPLSKNKLVLQASADQSDMQAAAGEDAATKETEK